MTDEKSDDPMNAAPDLRFHFERTWRHNPLIWIVLVVAMFIAVPLLASWSSERRAPVAALPAAAAKPAAALVPADAPVTVAPLPSAKPQAESSRQMVTKCVDRGRVIYTQTGECNGSITAVPIDADKNVVGANPPARTAPERSR